MAAIDWQFTGNVLRNWCEIEGKNQGRNGLDQRNLRHEASHLLRTRIWDELRLVRAGLSFARVFARMCKDTQAFCKAKCKPWQGYASVCKLRKDKAAYFRNSEEAVAGGAMGRDGTGKPLQPADRNVGATRTRRKTA